MLWSDCTQTSDGKVCITGAKGRYGCAGVVKTISLPQTGILILEILNKIFKKILAQFSYLNFVRRRRFLMPLVTILMLLFGTSFIVPWYQWTEGSGKPEIFFKIKTVKYFWIFSSIFIKLKVHSAWQYLQAAIYISESVYLYLSGDVCMGFMFTRRCGYSCGGSKLQNILLLIIKIAPDLNSFICMKHFCELQML